MKALKRFITITWLLLGSASFAANEQDVIASVEYFYAQDGTLIGRAVNGVRQNFEYDKRGQLLAVKDAAGRDLERYTYDPAGNRLSKTVYGITTTYTYDEANQLKTSTVNGETTHYRYDAAGRLVQAGDKTYYYFGANDKVTEVRQGDKVIAEFDYFMDGQIARAKYPDREEHFTWDGLALVQRSEVSYLNEPYVTGGNPILSSRDGVMFNDMLGSTLNIGGQPVSMTSFGESADDSAFFTGKPMISELGFSFLFRDYNPSQGKWTSSDPLGYPDGWNNLAYCNNLVVCCYDIIGCNLFELLDREAANGEGHSLPIVTVKQPDGSWIATGYNYSAKIFAVDGTFRDVKTFAGRTEKDVLRMLISYYDPKGKIYDNLYGWEIDNEKSRKAMDAMESEVKLPYAIQTHNCLNITKAGLEAGTGRCVDEEEWKPVRATTMRKNATDFTSFLERIHE